VFSQAFLFYGELTQYEELQKAIWSVLLLTFIIVFFVCDLEFGKNSLMHASNFHGVLFCIIILSFTEDCFSQNNGGIRIGIGHGSGYYITKEYQNGHSFLNWDEEQFSILKKEIVGYIECSLLSKQRFQLGIALSHSNFTFLNYYDYNNDQIKTKYYQTSLTISNRYYYFKNVIKHYQLYGSLNLGFSLKTSHSSQYLSSQMTYLKNETETTRIASHLNFIGISTGKKFGGYAELGWGFKGIINAGIFFKP
jgi:hypothetical protein